jgi:hypothetical protein
MKKKIAKTEKSMLNLYFFNIVHFEWRNGMLLAAFSAYSLLGRPSRFYKLVQILFCDFAYICIRRRQKE